MCVARKTKFRRLHLVGACPLVAGIDYTTFEVLGATVPSEKAYQAFCRNCWRGSSKPEGEPVECDRTQDDDESLISSLSSDE